MCCRFTFKTMTSLLAQLKCECGSKLSAQPNAIPVMAFILNLRDRSLIMIMGAGGGGGLQNGKGWGGLYSQVLPL